MVEPVHILPVLSPLLNPETTKLRVLVTYGLLKAAGDVLNDRLFSLWYVPKLGQGLLCKLADA